MRRHLALLALLWGLLGLVAVPSASAQAADNAPPETIRVCRSSGAVETVPFKEYVKTVLPVEFYASWPESTLRAGAAVIRSYAWYYIRNPISAECDLGDTTRHQVYAPEKQRRTARSDRMVEESWHLRMWDPSRNEIAFAQYCSNGCRVHARYAGEGRYMDQDQAHDLGAAGQSAVEMLHHFYRNLPMELTDWRDGLAVTSRSDLVALDDADATLVADVAGVAPGDGRVQVAAFVACTIDGTAGAHLLQVVPVGQDGGGRSVAVFDQLASMTNCQEAEAGIHVQLLVNGHVARTTVVPAWRRWSSAAERPVETMARVEGPVLAAVQVSEAVFAPVEPAASGDGNLIESVLGSEDNEAPDSARADYAVLAQSGAFPDALGATALAGTDAPILLQPPGADQSLNDAVAEELVRVLEPGSTVHLVGGRQALSEQVARDVEDLGFDPVRTSGPDRVATALAVASAVRADGGAQDRVLLVRALPNDASGWADAVAAGPWAARTRTPVLVTGPDGLDDRVEAFIEDPEHGIDEVVVIGGRGAVAGDVEERIEGAEVVRIAGPTRDATTLAVADELWGTRGTPAPAGVVVQNPFEDDGWSFAVVAAVPAARRDLAAVAVWHKVPPSTTGLWLDARPELGALVVGGTSNVSQSVVRALAGPA